MPLEHYARGSTWWARGRVELNGLPITDYIRESTGASSESGARQWCAEREASEVRRHLVGEKESLTFNDALLLYDPTPDMAKYLIPIAERIGHMFLSDITAQTVRDLGPALYPKNATDTWRRWVIAPARAVINRAHAHGKCGYLRVEGYENKERVKQDRKRGKRSRIKKTPGSWEWLLRFRQHADRKHAALALFMFATGARVGQSVAMHPDHLKLDNSKVIVPGAKGHEDREIEIPPELVDELRALPPLYPRGWERKPRNLRVFGFASKDSPRKGWISACKKAGIPYLPPHSAGRHGFGQEMRVRQGVDKKAVGEFGGWSDTELLDSTYTHGEDSDAKILEAFRTGRVQAEKETGIKLRDSNV